MPGLCVLESREGAVQVMTKKKKYTLLQDMRKSHARTKGADARIARNIRELLPTITRSKVDDPLTKRELNQIILVRDMLTTRLEIAMYDAALRDIAKHVRNQ